MPIVSIEFEYRHKTYFALVRIKGKQFEEYHVTIMNGPLEQRLYGNHIFIEEGGAIVSDPVPDKETGQLRLSVGRGIAKHFNKDCCPKENVI
ncbi:hypothetical protein [Niastella sp. OAS944]|uniref:hypothetical protein n=1 Tax=Niastella sp. OAS944 TaxID=2664089 RepID=UPI0035C7AC1A|nr:hypothetical protein [Chitinophagaceae bacterium OAS944]